jgi:hypothetical protein
MGSSLVGWLVGTGQGVAVALSAGDGRVGVAVGTGSTVGAVGLTDGTLAVVGLGVDAAVGDGLVAVELGDGDGDDGDDDEGAGVAVGDDPPDGVASGVVVGEAGDHEPGSSSCAGASEPSPSTPGPGSSPGALPRALCDRSGDPAGRCASFRRARCFAARRRWAAPCSRTVGTEPKRRSRASVNDGRPPGASRTLWSASPTVPRSPGRMGW